MKDLPRQVKDITGQSFFRLTVVEYVGTDRYGQSLWKCQCSCGNSTVVGGTRLRRGGTKSCGCFKIESIKERFNDNRESLLGLIFGKLQVLRFVGVEDYSARFECLCECGNYTIARSNDLKSGDTRSCGCLKIEISKSIQTTHGLATHPLYDTWNGMIQRCFNPKAPNFEYYGGRGITVCDEWQGSPKEFIDWAESNGYSPGLTLDRYPNMNGNYEPGNVRWATSVEQNRNTRRNIITPDLVEQIRKDPRPNVDIGRDIGVSGPHIGQIKLRKSWGDI